MPTIGEQLRAAREAKGLQIADAHRQTKIHARLLQAMEEDRAGEVLDPTYAKGFLKKYATFLNLDPAPLVEEYLKMEPTAAASAPPLPPTGGDGRPWAKPPRLAGARWVVPAIVAVIALVGVVFLGLLAKDLYHTVSTPAPASAPSTKPTPATPPPPPPKLIVPRSQPLKVSVKAAQDCWMQVKADDKVLFQNILGRGREETWTAKEAVELWVGNAAALSLTLNGHPLGSLGSGVIKGIRVTRAGVELPKKSSTAR